MHDTRLLAESTIAIQTEGILFGWTRNRYIWDESEDRHGTIPLYIVRIIV